MIPRMLNDYVAIRKIIPEKTEGGIYYGVKPDKIDPMKDSKEVMPDYFIRGEVLAVGPGRKNNRGDRVSMDLKSGDFVQFHTNFGQVSPFDKDVLFMKEECVMGVEE